MSKRLAHTLQKWEASFDASDDARLIRRSMLRECTCNDLKPDVWADFLKALLYEHSDDFPFDAIDKILAQDIIKRRFFLPGRAISAPRNDLIYHYVRIDRFIEQSLDVVIGGEDTAARVASEIRSGRMSGKHLMIGLEGHPVWVTDDSLSQENDSDIVRNRLGLRSLHQADHSLVELQYEAGMVADGLRSPTVLDAWREGCRLSWLFTKQQNLDGWGRTIDLGLGGGGSLGVPEAVHAPVFVTRTDSRQVKLRVLSPTTGPPPEMSLYALHENPDV